LAPWHQDQGVTREEVRTSHPSLAPPCACSPTCSLPFVLAPPRAGSRVCRSPMLAPPRDCSPTTCSLPRVLASPRDRSPLCSLPRARTPDFVDTQARPGRVIALAPPRSIALAPPRSIALAPPRVVPLMLARSIVLTPPRLIGIGCPSVDAVSFHCTLGAVALEDLEATFHECKWEESMGMGARARMFNKPWRTLII
jgi:hypothetical protein